MISLAAATGLGEAIEAARADPGQVVRSVGLDRTALEDPHGFVPSADFARVLEAAAHETGDECFGLHFGERFHPKDLGPLVYVVVNSPSFAAGFENVARYLRVHNEAAEVGFVAGPPRWYMRHALNLSAVSHRQHDEYSLAVAVGTIRLMAGSDWAPIEVRFQHRAPARTAEHVRVFGAPVSFGHAANAIVVERDLAERQVPAADARLYPILKDLLERILDEMPPVDGLLTSARRAIAESMRHGDPTVAQVARRLDLGPRTLQRHLEQHGTTFMRLVDDTRRQFSLRYLRDPKHTLTDIAYLLGYSEVSAFNRAFRRWTGSTPTDFRR
jgi:AraC-like DNA-binding protein